MKWQIHRFARLESTMLQAAEMPVGSVVIADEQTAGVGRHGHGWDSQKNAGLYVSMVLPPHPVLTLALGLAGHAAIRRATSLECDIRWPNDLLLSERKFAGILVQMQGERAVAGVGINVLQRSFPEELRMIATSLAMETGLDFDREEILRALLDEVPPATALPPADVIRRWERTSSWAMGKAVQVEMGDRVVRGTTVGLEAGGFLLVREADGCLNTIVAGGVRARERNPNEDAAGSGCGQHKRHDWGV